MSDEIDMKPMLNISDQIEHLEKKGIRFEIMGKEQAAEYLSYGNNYFKVASYRKNYPKHPGGKNEGKYIDLDFAYLVDLAIIDMRLRYRIVHMALDIEHHAKLKILREVEKAGEDGYLIVRDFIDSIGDTQRDILKGEINRNRNNIYCGDIISKYDGHYPVWAFLEIVPFGRMLSFYNFCSSRFESKEMSFDYYVLRTCREIRNASAHSNCILNDLKSNNTSRKTAKSVTHTLSRIDDLRPNFRVLRMSNSRIQQIVTLFYVYKKIVESPGLLKYESKELHILADRMFEHNTYYLNNPIIMDSFVFLKIVIDSWF